MTEETQETQSTEEVVATKVSVDRTKYTEVRAASGAKSLSNGDEVAVILGGLPLEAVHAIGTEALEMDTKEKYGHLNGGMQRMNVGNRLRGWVNKAPEGENRLAFVAGISEPHITAVKEANEAKEAEKVKAAEAKEAEKAEKAKAEKAKAEKAKAEKAKAEK